MNVLACKCIDFNGGQHPTRRGARAPNSKFPKNPDRNGSVVRSASEVKKETLLCVRARYEINPAPEIAMHDDCRRLDSFLFKNKCLVSWFRANRVRYRTVACYSWQLVEETFSEL